ncbi:hypothetical protein JCM8097_008383 [Rhodosporidiobolus ruineniae]
MSLLAAPKPPDPPLPQPLLQPAPTRNAQSGSPSASALNAPPQPAPPEGYVRVKDDKSATSARERAYERQLREQVVRTSAATVAGVLLASFAPVPLSLRIVVAVLIAFTGLYTLTYRSHFLILDYSSLPSSSSSPPSAPRDGDDPPNFESAEWLQGILAQLWPIIDRQLLVAVVDLMEDAIKAESPGVVRAQHSVRITSLSPGSHPVRLTGLRILPSSPSQPFRYFHTRLLPHQSPSLRSQEAASPTGVEGPSHAEGSYETESGREGTRSALQNPSVPQPAPWSADPEEQGQATHGANQGRSGSGEGGEGGERTFGPRSREEVDPAPSSSQGEDGRTGEDQRAVPGPYVELEAEFEYHRAMTPREKSEEGRRGTGGEKGDGGAEEDEGGIAPQEAAENINFVAYLGLGAPKLVTVPIPVLLAVTHLRGAVHLRLQLVPEPPFVKTVGFGLREVPEVGISAHPLQGPLDIMTLPLLRSYIYRAVRSVIDGFVLPRHYAVDLRKVMLGGDVAMKTRTSGLLVLVLHSARQLPASDPSLRPLHLPVPGSQRRERRKTEGKKGKSDPFVSVGWAGTGKVLYKTRIVPSTLDPVWEEMCFVRVPQEPIEDGAKLRLTVIDHDRFNPNDTLGYLDLPIASLAARPGEWEKRRKEPLRRSAGKDALNRSGGEGEDRGEVEFSAAFFPLSEKLRSAQPSRSDEEKDKDDADLLGDADLDARARLSEEEHEKRKKSRLGKMDELLNARHPTPRSHPSGILSFQIHQIASLELPNKSSGPVKSVLQTALKPGQTNTIRKADLPSSYVEAFVCDEMVFRTRLKPFSNAPYFNTGSETFVRDWQDATLDFAVMDYRDRDHDVLAGFVHLDLGEVLEEKCQVTKWYPIVGGAGSGRLRASVLFKPLAMEVPRGLREWSIGTLEVVHAKVEGDLPEGFSGRLSFKVEEGGKGATGVSSSSEDNGSSLTFDLPHPIILPVLSRLAPVQVRLEEHHGVRKDKGVGFGLFWMNDVVRGKDEEIEVELNEKRPLVVPNPHDLPTLYPDPPSEHPHTDAPATSSSSQPPSLALGNAAGSSDHSKLPPSVATYDKPSHSGSPPPATDPSLSSSSPSADSPSRTRTLHLTLRWRPGISSHHSDLVLSSSSAARASYQLYLHREDHAAQQRRERREDRRYEQGRAGGMGVGVKEEEGRESWESDSEDEKEAKGMQGKTEIVAKGDGRRKRKGGTLRWAGHVAKVATRRFAKARHHHVDDPKPETELQSAL